MAFDFPSSPTVGQVFSSGGTSYVWNGQGWVQQGATSPYVAKTGDTMSGPLVLSGDPTVAYGAATRQYVDNYATPADVSAYSGMQVNGAMEVSQELGTYTGRSVGGGGPMCDAWGCGCGTPGSTAFLGQVNGGGIPGQFGAYISLQATVAALTVAAATYVVFTQNIEGWRVKRLGFGAATGIPVTVCFWMYATIAGTMSVTLRNGAATRSCSINVSFTGTGWEWKTVTFPACTDAVWEVGTSTGLTVMFCFAVGATYQVPTPGVWANGNYLGTAQTTNFFATSGNYAYVGGVIVLPGTAAPPLAKATYLQRPFDQELAICKRYYEKSYNYDLVPGTVDSSGVETMTVDGLPSVARVWQKDVRFAVQKRIPPTVTLYSDVTGSSGVIRNRQAGTELTATAQRIGHTGFQMSTNPSTDAAIAMTFHWVAAARQ